LQTIGAAAAADNIAPVVGELLKHYHAFIETVRRMPKIVLSSVAGGDALELDLSEVTEMDSAGVQLLMAAKKTAVASGSELRITGRSPAVSEVFQTLRLEAHFADLKPSPPPASTH